MKSSIIALFVCLPVAVCGCNWTDGPCWYADGGSTSVAGVGVGGSFGVSVGVGAGGKGDYPSPAPQSAGDEDEPICNKSDLPAEKGDEKSPVEDENEQGALERDFALRVATAAYAANVTAYLVEAQVPDPEQLDPATLDRLVEESAPAGWSMAQAWASTIDATALSINRGMYPKEECTEQPYLCKRRTWCPFGGEGGANCSVTQCGTGKCPWCPFGGNLIFKAWCAYGCIRNSDGEIVGGAFILRTIFNNDNGPFCIKF